MNRVRHLLGGQEDTIRPQEANPLAVYQFSRQIATTVIRGLQAGEPWIRGDGRRERLMLFLRPESVSLLRLACANGSAAMAVNESRRTSVIEFPFSGLTHAIADISEAAVYEDMPHTTDAGQWHPLDSHEGAFHWIFLSFEGISWTESNFGYWIREYLARYLAPGGIGVIYTVDNQPVDILCEEAPAELCEFADASGRLSLVKTDSTLTPSQLHPILESANLRALGCRLNQRVVVDPQRVDNLIAKMETLFSPARIDRGEWADWINDREGLVTQFVMVEKL